MIIFNLVLFFIIRMNHFFIFFSFILRNRVYFHFFNRNIFILRNVFLFIVCHLLNINLRIWFINLVRRSYFARWHRRSCRCFSGRICDLLAACTVESDINWPGLELLHWFEEDNFFFLLDFSQVWADGGFVVSTVNVWNGLRWRGGVF